MAQVKIGPEFFAKAKNDYAEWQWALVREYLQNSIDCGSSLIKLRIHQDADSTTLIVENNGAPMTEDVLVNKLLSLGSSGKNFAGSVGGFGKAKELLYFCHRSYCIETGKLVVNGSGAEYSLGKSKQAVDGTRSTIVIEGRHQADLVEKAQLFVALCGVNCKFEVNGQLTDSKLRKGAYRRDLNCGKVYTNRQMHNLVVVRIGGIPMFTCYTKFDGCVVLELDGASSKTLTSNRDGLRYDARAELEGFLSDLTVNKRRALRQPVIEYHRYEGNKISCTGMQKQAAAHGLQELGSKLDSLNTQEEVGPAIDTAALATDGSYGQRTVELNDWVKSNALINAFIIKNETGRTIPAAYRPDHEKFGKYAYRLATIWSRLMTVMHRIFGVEGEFTVGFIFSEDAIAQYERSNEHGVVYYINPVKIADGTMVKRWEYSFGYGREDLNQLAISALHELVHGMGYGDHDEDYASKLTEMAGKLLGHTKELLWCYKK